MTPENTLTPVTIPPDYDTDHRVLLGLDERVWAGALLSLQVGALVFSIPGAGPVSVLVAAALGATFIDALSYVMHRWLDNTTTSGPAARIAFEFQVHHVRTGDVVKRGWLRNNSLELGLYITAPMSVLSLFLPTGGLTAMFFAFSGVWGTLIPTVHAWSHQQKKHHVIVRWLQRARIILAPTEHRKHHHGPDCHFRSYALLNGWTNGPLDLILAGRPKGGNP